MHAVTVDKDVGGDEFLPEIRHGFDCLLGRHLAGLAVFVSTNEEDESRHVEEK